MHEIIDIAVSAGVLLAELLLLFVAVSFLVVLANRRLGPHACGGGSGEGPSSERLRVWPWGW